MKRYLANGLPIILMLLRMHGDLFSSFYIVLRLLGEEADVGSLVLQLLFHDFEEIVLRAPHLPARGPGRVVSVSERLRDIA